MLKRIHFEDQGQDFMFWVINSDGKVIQCEPFQHDVWFETEVINPSDLTTGDCVRTFDGLIIKYPIESIDEIRDYTKTSVDDAVVSIKLAINNGLSVDDLEANLAAELAGQNRASLVNFLEQKIKTLKKKR